MTSSLIISCKGKTFNIYDKSIAIYIIYPDGIEKEFKICDIKNHDAEYIKIGYCANMKIITKNNNEFIRVNISKKDVEIRNFFDYNSTKVTYYLNVLNCNPKYIYYNELIDMNEKECNAYLCGLISAHCNVNLTGEYRRQCIRFRLPEKREQINKNKSNKWFEFYQKISKFITYTSGNGLGVVCSIPNLYYFICNISVINNNKLNDIINLFFLKIDKSENYDIKINFLEKS
jgi:hypothetical protein